MGREEQLRIRETSQGVRSGGRVFVDGRGDVHGRLRRNRRQPQASVQLRGVEAGDRSTLAHVPARVRRYILVLRFG